MGKLSREIFDALNRGIRVEVQLFGQLAPMMKVDIAQTVFAAELHGKLDALDVDVRIWQDARQVIKGRKTDAGFGRR